MSLQAEQYRMYASWIIDDDGEAWSENGSDLYQKFKSMRAGSGLKKFLVNQLGCISIKALSNRTNVLFHDQRVSPVALTGYLYWQSSLPFKPTTFESACNDNITHVLSDRTKWLQFVSGLIEERTPRPDFSAVETTIELTNFSGQWRVAQQIFQEVEAIAVRDRLINTLFDGHFMLAKIVESGEFQVEVLGSHHYDHDREFAQSQVGGSVRDCYDKEFGKWTADRFINFRESRTPVTEQIDALIRFPRHTRRRYSYGRLLVPLVDNSGHAFLLSAASLK